MNDDNTGIFLGLVGALLVFGLPIGFGIAFSINQAESEAKLYNNTYGTAYTRKDFFFAGNTIKDYLNKGQNTTLNVNAKVDQ